MNLGDAKKGIGMSEFRQKCIGKANLVGSFAAIPHPVAVEVMALSASTSSASTGNMRRSRVT